MENQLTALEAKIDELLAQAEAHQSQGDSAGATGAEGQHEDKSTKKAQDG